MSNYLLFFSEGAIIVSNRTKTSLTFTDLAAFPLFIRINNFELPYWFGLRPIEEKIELIEPQLITLKSVLKDANMIDFNAGISHAHQYHFNNHSSLLDYLQNRLLIICDLAQSYKFIIGFFLDTNAITNVIGSILQMAPIKCCSTVELICISYSLEVQKQFPVEAISNWLEMSAVRMEINDRKQKEKFLKILMMGIQNARELIDHLKMVYL